MPLAAALARPLPARLLLDLLAAAEALALLRDWPRLGCPALDEARVEASEGALRAACAAPAGRCRACRCWKAFSARLSAVVICARAPRHLLAIR